MRKYLVLAVVLMFVVGLLAATVAASKMMMDNSKWKIQMMSGKKGEKPMVNHLTFEKGMFDSQACHKFGMRTGKYTEKMKGKEMMWSAKVKGTKGTDSSWQGTVTGDKMKGTVTYSGKMKAKMSFTGMKLKAGGAAVAPIPPAPKPKKMPM